MYMNVVQHYNSQPQDNFSTLNITLICNYVGLRVESLCDSLIAIMWSGVEFFYDSLIAIRWSEEPLLLQSTISPTK